MSTRNRKSVAIVSAIAMLAATLFALATAPSANAADPINFTFRFVNGQVVSGVASDKTHFIPNAGGSSADNPTGMTVHLSCSDKFSGGWGEKDGPVQGVDTAWQIATYFIQKGNKTCGTPTPPQPPPAPPAIDIEKYVNGQDADDPTGPQVNIGDTVTFTYEVTNTGGIPLRNVNVTDSTLGPITCPKSELAVGESMSCSPQTEVATKQGQFTMKATVTGIGDILTPGIPAGSAKKAYRFTFVNGTTIVGSSEKNEAFLPNAGGSSASNPTGMTVHVSCSDSFPGGWGKKDGPQQGVDTAWQIASFSIAEVKDGKVKKSCGDPFAIPVPQEVMDMDPIYFIVPPPPTTTTTTQPTTTTTKPTTTTTQPTTTKPTTTTTKPTTTTTRPTTTTTQPTTTTTGPTTTKPTTTTTGPTTTRPKPPLECVVRVTENGPKISWNSVNADSYEVWRGAMPVGVTSELMLTDFTAPVGQPLFYRVVAMLPDWQVIVADCGKVTVPYPQPRCSVTLKFYNHTSDVVKVNWVGPDGQETTLGTPGPGETFHWDEFVEQQWKVYDSAGRLLKHFRPDHCGENFVLITSKYK